MPIIDTDVSIFVWSVADIYCNIDYWTLEDSKNAELQGQ